MDVRGALEGICEIQQRMDVTQIKWHDIAVWPVLREMIAAASFHEGRAGVPARPAKAAPTSRARQHADTARRWWRSRRSFRTFSRTGHGKIIAASDPVYHTESAGGQLYDRFADPLIAILHDRDIVKIEPRSRNVGARHRPPFGFEVEGCYDMAARSLRRADKEARDPAAAIAGYRQVMRHAGELSGITLPAPRQLMQSLSRLRTLAHYFETALCAVRPRAVFVVCYYAPEMRALTLACRRLGIPVLDLQHGKQGRFHHAYTHWQQVPKGGWQLLPDVFCVWGEESRTNIVSHLPERESHHQAVVVGNLWMALWNGEDHPVLDPEHEAFLRRLSRFRRTVLVTLQPLNEPLPDTLLDAMTRAPADWMWLVRMHPNMRASTGILSERLERVAAGRFEMTLATAMPLYALLRHAGHHVTGWSSVAYEALSFGVPTTLIHPTARQLYPDYIARDHFRYAADGEALCRSIEAAERPTMEEENPYIVSDLAFVRTSLDALLATRAA
jgi:hypothetical protein